MIKDDNEEEVDIGIDIYEDMDIYVYYKKQSFQPLCWVYPSYSMNQEVIWNPMLVYSYPYNQ